jgi:multiple sugar transport system permease protein
MVLGSFKDEGELRRVPPTWWPQSPSLDNYTELFARLDFGTYFANSVIVSLAITAGNLLFCSMLGYALAKLDFRGRRLVFSLVIGTLMVPALVTFVPLYVLVANMKLTGSLLGLILPFLAGPFGVFLMRQFISTLPDELIDAARVDGCRELAIFWRVILPLTRPALATLGIITFLGSWNSFLWPLVVAQNQDQYTLPVGLALASSGQSFTRYGILLAGAVVVLLPVMLVFLRFQRQFVAGIATTGLK